MSLLSLHARQAAQGARFGTLRGRTLALRWADPLTEYQAALTGAGLCDFSARESLRLEGPDRTGFLQGMVTQDLRPLGEGAATYTALLTVKGAMVSDARVLNLPDALSVDVEPGFGAKVQASLERFLISEDAELHRDDSGHWLGLHGPLAFERWRRLAPNAPPSGRAEVAGHEVWAVPWNRVGLPGLELWVSAQAVDAVYAALAQLPDVHPLGFEALELLRVEAGLPRFGQDMGENTLPLEAHLEHALSYTKGCYLGQEVIARATYRGHMNRHLCGLLLGATPAPEGAALWADTKKVGWLTSVIRSPARSEYVALGSVHRDHQAPGTALRIEGLDTKAVLAPLPFRPG